MPLFLLIRHGESTANRRDFVRALAARAERLTPRQAYARRLAEPREANGDPVLTDNGLRQAELLGRFWSNILYSTGSRKAGCMSSSANIHSRGAVSTLGSTSGAFVSASSSEHLSDSRSNNTA